jgi:hypothetical protein
MNSAAPLSRINLPYEPARNPPKKVAKKGHRNQQPDPEPTTQLCEQNQTVA